MNLLFANDRAGRYPSSYYAAALPGHLRDRPARGPLRGELHADVCVVGAGFTGLSAALHLARRGLSVVVLEAHRAGFGASGRNGGQIGSGQRLEQDALEAMVGRADARRLWDLAQDAKALVRGLVAEGAMPAALRPGVAHACRHPREVGHAHAYAEKLAREYDYDAVEPLDRAGIAALTGSPVFAGGTLDHEAGHLDPLVFALGLADLAEAAGATIHEGTLVEGIDRQGGAAGPGTLVLHAAQGGTVRAGQVVLACNGYLGGLNGRVAARVMPINNFIVATAPLGAEHAAILPRDVAVADSRFVVNYWRRSPDGRLLFGGGESYGYRFPRDIAAVVRRPMLRIYPQLADLPVTHAWGGTLAITMNRLPHFARPAPGILSAGGYSGHGVAMATLAGRLLAEAAAGMSEGFDLMARLPAPRFPGGATLRAPLLALAMRWYAMRDLIGL